MARQIKRLLQSELKHASKWAYALILVVYAYMVVLQLDSFPMWFCSLRENSFLGFFPDPTLRLSAEDVLLFGNAEVFRGLLFNVAPLAHALFFPFIAACIVPRFVSSGFVEEPWGLSEARGGKRVCAIVARVVLSSFALLGAFILTSVVLYCLNCAIVLDAQQYFNLNIFCYRLVLAACCLPCIRGFLRNRCFLFWVRHRSDSACCCLSTSWRSTYSSGPIPCFRFRPRCSCGFAA